MDTIEIKTSQNVTIEYELAPLRERILAFFIDLIIVLAAYIMIMIMVFSLFPGMDVDGMLMYVLYSIVPIGIFILYQLASEAFHHGQSLGKKSMALKVVRLDGRQPSLSDYTLRAVFHLIDTILSLGVLGALLISSTTRHQRLGDMTANTTVIRTRSNLRFQLSDILRINTLENYTPQYPAVQQFSEQDMLLIKNVIARYRSFPNQAHADIVRSLSRKLAGQLGLAESPREEMEFLKTLIRDYIVLTR